MIYHPIEQTLLHKLINEFGVRAPRCVVVPPVVARWFALKPGEPVDECVWAFLQRLEMMRDGRFPFFERVGIELAMYGHLPKNAIARFKR